MKRGVLMAGASLICFPALAQQVTNPGIPPSAIGQPNGVAPLDSNGNVPFAHLSPIAAAYNNGIQVIATRGSGTPYGVTTQNNSRASSREKLFFPYGATSMEFVLPGFSMLSSSGNVGEFPLSDSVFYMTACNVVSGGTNYIAGDQITFPVYGYGMTPAICQVDSVSAGAITSAHVIRSGAYATQLPSGTGPASVQQAGYGYGAYAEANVSGTIPGGTLQLNSQQHGFNYVAANTFISWETGTGCTGSTFSPNYDNITKGLVSISQSGGSGCAAASPNAPVAISTGVTGTLGSGATFNFTWGGAAYMIHLSVDPTYTNESCPSGSLNIDACQHVVVTADSGAPPNVSQDASGMPGDIFVKSGQSVVTDFIPIYVPIGGSAGLRMTIYGSYPVSRYAQLSGETLTGGATVLDQSRNASVFGTSYAIGAIQQPMMFPVAVIGHPLIAGPALYAEGDSRLNGVDSVADTTQADTYDIVYGNKGWLERSLGVASGGVPMPFINISRGGDTMKGKMKSAAMRDQASRLVAKIGKFPTLCYEGLNINDFASGVSFATVQAQEAQRVQFMRGLGCKFVFTDTSMPEISFSAAPFTSLGWLQISAQGTGYCVSCTFTATVAGGTFTSAATVSLSTDPNGKVVGINNILTNGQYSVNPTITNNALTGGTGTGLTVNLFMTNDVPGVTQTALNTANAQAALRNAQLRATNFGTYAGIYDGVIDWSGVAESAVTPQTFLPYITVDGIHYTPQGMQTMAAYAGPILANWAKIYSLQQ